MDKANPAARQAMLGRLLEVDRQGTYKFTDSERKQMVDEYARNVSEHGLDCTANTFGNHALKIDIAKQVKSLTKEQQIPLSLQKDFVQQELKTTKAAPKPSAATLSASGRLSSPSALPSSFRGYKITYIKSATLIERSRQFVEQYFLSFLLLWCGSIAFGVVLGIARWKYLKPDLQLGLTRRNPLGQ